MASPTPHDKRVWHYSQILGWPQRRIATEIGISQATVTRILHRLEAEPPTDEEMAAFVSSATPPNGLPVIGSGRRLVLSSPLWYALAIAVVMLALSFAAVLFAAAISLLSHQKGDPGPPGPAGPRGSAGITASRAPAWLCITTDPATGNVIKVTVRADADCGTGTGVRIP